MTIRSNTLVNAEIQYPFWFIKYGAQDTLGNI
jgi:hypothetical protein